MNFYLFKQNYLLFFILFVFFTLTPEYVAGKQKKKPAKPHHSVTKKPPVHPVTEHIPVKEEIPVTEKLSVTPGKEQIPINLGTEQFPINSRVEQNPMTEKLSLKKPEKGLNSQSNVGTPIQKSATCKFGLPVAGACQCDDKKQELICSSDGETFSTVCEFDCAQKCSPRLLRFDGECSKDGRPQRTRLDYTKREKKGEEDDTPNSNFTDSDYDEPQGVVPSASGQSAGQLGRSLGGVNSMAWAGAGIAWDSFAV